MKRIKAIYTDSRGGITEGEILAFLPSPSIDCRDAAVFSPLQPVGPELKYRELQVLEIMSLRIYH